MKIWVPIIVVTIFMLGYNSLPFWGANIGLIVVLFFASPFPVIWMVYRILKDGKPSDKTWEDYFYEDHPYKRNGREDATKPQ